MKILYNTTTLQPKLISITNYFTKCLFTYHIFIIKEKYLNKLCLNRKNIRNSNKRNI